MQRFVTPHPGRTPGANVINTLNYKVNIRLTELRNDTWQLVTETWTPEHGWVYRELFLTAEELSRYQAALGIKS